MSLWSRLISAVVRKSMTPDEWWEEFGGGYSRSSTGLSVNQFTTLQVTTAMACVTVLAEDVAKLPLHVYRLVKGERVIAEDHPLEALFRRPNDWQTRFEFIEMLMGCLLLRSNGYAAKVRNWRGEVQYLVPLNPDRVWIYEAPDGQIFYNVARRGMHDIAVLKSLPLMVHSDDMLHVRGMALDSSLWGFGRVSATREAIGLSLAQQELAARLAGNNTNLGGVLQTDQKLSQDAVDRLKQQWRTLFSGLRNTGETAVLQQGMKWQAMGMTAVDAEFLNSRKFSVEEVARIFRVPLHKIGVLGSHATGTSLVQLDQEYLNSTLSPWCERISAKLDHAFDVGAGYFVAFDYSEFLKADMMTRLQAKRLGVTGGIYTANEARFGEGLGPKPGGDKLLVPVNMIPIDKVGTTGGSGPGSDISGTSADGGDGDPAATPDSGPNV